jgi:hypothetical protein
LLSWCFPPSPLFCLKDLTGAFAVGKESVKVEILPMEPPFAPGGFADVLGKLTEFGEVEAEGSEVFMIICG